MSSTLVSLPESSSEMVPGPHEIKNKTVIEAILMDETIAQAKLTAQPSTQKSQIYSSTPSHKFIIE